MQTGSIKMIVFLFNLKRKIAENKLTHLTPKVMRLLPSKSK
jgi:hypothetical protein